MRYFLDTEFIERDRDEGALVRLDLISIGIAAEDGREYYAQNIACEFGIAGDWVRRNVFPKLEHFGRTRCRCQRLDAECPWRNPSDIARELAAFCDPQKYGNPEFWGYFGAFDWVIVCRLFGGMTRLPAGWPQLCRDVCQLWGTLGDMKLPEQDPATEHHALGDARWTKAVWEFLDRVERQARTGG